MRDLSLHNKINTSSRTMVKGKQVQSDLAKSEQPETQIHSKPKDHYSREETVLNQQVKMVKVEHHNSHCFYSRLGVTYVFDEQCKKP